jgi:hypothetical protein
MGKYYKPLSTVIDLALAQESRPFYPYWEA